MRDESKSASLEQLSAGLRDRTAVIGLVGLGYIRLQLM
jgi:UDP-N-acetyl-D-glucosamine dehydrogenase